MTVEQLEVLKKQGNISRKINQAGKDVQKTIKTTNGILNNLPTNQNQQ
jgi:hypothetical protein